MNKTLLRHFALTALFSFTVFLSNSFAQTIAVDYDFSEWTTVGTEVGTINGVTVKVVDDPAQPGLLFLYVSGSNLNGTNNIFVNMDGDQLTGYDEGSFPAGEQGADALIQGAFTYQSVHTTGNGGWGWNPEQSGIPYAVGTDPITGNTTEIELSFDIYNFTVANTISVAASIMNEGSVVNVSLLDGFWAEFTFQQTVLPVSLLSFVGEAEKGSSNVLRWSTTSEVDNNYFEVQKSTDGLTWTVENEVIGAGTTETVQHYDWIDKTPYTTTYYRLKQIDFSGYFVYSQIIIINNGRTDATAVTFSPNPAVNEVKLISKSQIDVAAISIFDAAGREITGRINVSAVSDLSVLLDFATVNSGIYFVKTGTTFERLVIAK